MSTGNFIELPSRRQSPRYQCQCRSPHLLGTRHAFSSEPLHWEVTHPPRFSALSDRRRAPAHQLLLRRHYSHVGPQVTQVFPWVRRRIYYTLKPSIPPPPFSLLCSTLNMNNATFSTLSFSCPSVLQNVQISFPTQEERSVHRLRGSLAGRGPVRPASYLALPRGQYPANS
jgi:hypothetical protein